MSHRETITLPRMLLVTVGLPRSGKSTWAKSTGWPIVSSDAIRLAIHGKPFIEQAETLVSAVARYMVKALFLAGHEIVIVDGTNITRKRREYWKWNHADDDPERRWHIRFVEFDTALEDCLFRAEMGEPLALRDVIRRMAAAREPLDVDEITWWEGGAYGRHNLSITNKVVTSLSHWAREEPADWLINHSAEKAGGA